MSLQRFRSASIYAFGKKVGQFESFDYEEVSGDEPQFGDPGGLGYSDGAMTTKLSASGVVPVLGMDFDFEANLRAKAYIDIALAGINGKIHQITMRVLSAKWKGSQKAGTLMGDFEMGGFEPSVQ